MHWDVMRASALRWIVASVVLGSIGIFSFFLFSPIIQVREITVERLSPRLDIEEVQNTLSSLFGKHLFFLSSFEVAGLLEESIPDIASVTIDKEYVSTLNVRIALDPLVARLRILDPDTNPDAAGTGATIDFLTDEGIYIQTTAAKDTETLTEIQLVDWGVRPRPGTLLIQPAFIERINAAEIAFLRQFGKEVRRRTVFLRAQEFHLLVGETELWFDLKSPLADQLERYRTFLRAVGTEETYEYIDLRISNRIIYQFSSESHRVYEMYKTLIASLFFGLFPTVNGAHSDGLTLENMSIAPPSESVFLDEHLSASGVVIFNRDSGQILYTRESKIQRPMASLTKLMTALIIVENHELDEMITIPQSVTDVIGNKAYLSPGEKFTVGDILSALLINSANDAALTLAQFHSGSSAAFVRAMNERALELGLRSTSFQNAAGLDHPAHWSTPQDMAWLAMFALRYPAIAERMSMPGKRITGTGGESIPLYHTHVQLHQQAETEAKVIAGKTGTTNGAGQCLLSVVELHGTEYVVVLLYSDQRYADMETILTALSKNDPTPIASARALHSEL